MVYAKYTIVLSLLVLMGMGCKPETPIPGSGGPISTPDIDSWLIPLDEVLDGGPGKDGILALEMPQHVLPSEISYLDEDALVIGVQINGEAIAYPHTLLDWHELVNDQVGGEYITVNYCPLTGSGMVWNRMIAGAPTTFGVSGLLYNTNLILYDRATNSHWSQMLRQSVEGYHRSTQPDQFQMVETTWRTWKKMAPHTKVLTLNTGQSRPYDRYPYGNYRSTDFLYFPVRNRAIDYDRDIFEKERVYGVPESGANVRLFQFKHFVGGALQHVQLMSGEAVVVGHQTQNWMVAFRNIIKDGQPYRFTYVPDALPVIMKDDFGNSYDVWGFVVEGPETGTRLQPLRGFVAYHFSWPAFFQRIAY